uniref:Uncharacterized protein n=2 Tax=Oryza TaxID=4527 RepID=A0A0D3EUP3_9ORYZ
MGAVRFCWLIDDGGAAPVDRMRREFGLDGRHDGMDRSRIGARHEKRWLLCAEDRLYLRPWTWYGRVLALKESKYLEARWLVKWSSRTALASLRANRKCLATPCTISHG